MKFRVLLADLSCSNKSKVLKVTSQSKFDEHSGTERLTSDQPLYFTQL